MHINIVGAGIGGLCAALRLHDMGFDVEVYESATEMRPLGVGINLLPHAVRELGELGLVDELEQISVRTSSLQYYSRHGKLIWSEPRGREAGYVWPQLSIHRGELQMLLLRTAQQRLGHDRVHLGCSAVSVESTDARATLTILRRSTSSSEKVDGDVVIAADGIHSAIRRQFYPRETQPQWNGALLWRGTTVATPYLDARTMIMAGSMDQKFVCYPIKDPVDGKQLINWIAELRFPDRAVPDRNDWSSEGKLSDFLPAFEDWDFPWLDVPSMIRGGSGVWVYPMVDRDPLPTWTYGRVTLLGDAAHPMYPVGSNGASQAILDSATIAGCLSQIAEPVVALAAYEEHRREATARIVLSNRQQGPEEAMTTVEQRAPNGFENLHDVISQQELEEISLKYKRLAGFSIDELNASPSLSLKTYRT